MAAGVRQDGVLSPILFALYIDDIASSLSNAKLGCSVNGVYLGCLLYADDIILLSSSVHCLQSMLDVCCSILKSIDLKFNVNKSVLLRIGPRFKYECCNLYLDGSVLSFVKEVKYLGVVVKSGSQLNFGIDSIKSKFYRTFNAVFNKSKSAASELTSVFLLKSHCLPVLFYGIEATTYNRKYFCTIDSLINSAFGKIFGTFDLTLIAYLRVILNVPQIMEIYELRKKRFLQRYIS